MIRINENSWKTYILLASIGIGVIIVAYYYYGDYGDISSNFSNLYNNWLNRNNHTTPSVSDDSDALPIPGPDLMSRSSSGSSDSSSSTVKASEYDKYFKGS